MKQNIKGQSRSRQTQMIKKPIQKLRGSQRKAQLQFKLLKPSVVELEDYPYAKINDYSQIPQVPIITLDLKKSPFQQFSSIQQDYNKIGAAVLRTNWTMPNCFKFIQKPITTRIQTLQSLIKGQKIEAYSVKSFRHMAKRFQENYKFRTQAEDNDCLIEKEYWNILTNPKFKEPKVQVEYAADLPSNKYGSAFPTFKFQCNEVDYSQHPFNLNCINKQADSPFQILKGKREQISGVTSPWVFVMGICVYMGMMFSTFCWHTEDMYLSSLNYHHEGAKKSWYFIPPQFKEKFDEFINQNQTSKKGKDSVLNKLILQTDPLQLIRQKIPVYKCFQEPGDFVLTFPKVYHSGFSHGLNLTEAINILQFDNLHILWEVLQKQ